MQESIEKLIFGLENLYNSFKQYSNDLLTNLSDAENEDDFERGLTSLKIFYG